MEEKRISLVIYLMKETASNWYDCVDVNKDIQFFSVVPNLGIEGKIAIAKSRSKEPEWKEILQNFTPEKIEIPPNVSNRAVFLAKIEGRIMAITFGYGKSLLRDNFIERDFGVKTALNLLNKDQIRNVNSTSIENMIVYTQKQSSISTSQQDFSINQFNDILMSISGNANSADDAISLSGKDSLSVTVKMDILELKSKLTKYLEAYNSDEYIGNGFAWVDNVREVKEKNKKENLFAELAKKIERGELEDIYIAPPDIVDWEGVKGFTLSARTYTEIGYDIDYINYFQNVKKGVDLLAKLKRDYLIIVDFEGNEQKVCNIMKAIITQIRLEDKMYVLIQEKWLAVDQNFYEEVHSYIKTIPICNLEFKECKKDENEGDYNDRMASNSEFCVMNKRLISVKGGKKQIEACDIFTKNKEFIHVKNKYSSSALSHLFSQGKVSAKCFMSDEVYRENVYNIVKDKLGNEIFDFRYKPNANEYEVVYAIIDEKEKGTISERLPFFSLVNLMQAVQELDSMNMRFSVAFIKRQ